MTVETDQPAGLQREGSTRRCGTISGWQGHHDHGEKPCDACAAAKARYDARRMGTPVNTMKNRLSARAQGKASVALRALHKAEYDELFAQAKAQIYREYEEQYGPLGGER